MGLWEGPHLEGGRHPVAVRLAGHLLGHGLQAEEVVAILLLWNAVACDPPKEEGEVERLDEDLVANDDGRAPLELADLEEAARSSAALPAAVRALLTAADPKRRRAGAVRAAECGVPSGAVARLLRDAGEDDALGVARWAGKVASKAQHSRSQGAPWP